MLTVKPIYEKHYPRVACSSEDGALHWQVELIPEQSMNNFDFWVGFIIHKGDFLFPSSDVIHSICAAVMHGWLFSCLQRRSQQ